MRATRRSAALLTLAVLAGTTPVAIAAGKPVRSDAVTVRPGAVINITLPHGPNPLQPGPYENSCTAGFLFRATSMRAPHRTSNFLTTAGHCLFVDDKATEEVHLDGSGPPVTLTALSPTGAAVPGRHLGSVVYAAQTIPVTFPDANLPDFFDLGVVQLDQDVVVNPALCHFGGPTGLRRGTFDTPEQLHFYGEGNVSGFNRETGRVLLPGRSAPGSTAAHPNVVAGASFGTPAPFTGGDSGAPIIDDQGRAVASLSGPYQPRLEMMIPRVEKVLGVKLTLLTAPVATGANPFGIDPACSPRPAS